MIRIPSKFTHEDRRHDADKRFRFSSSDVAIPAPGEGRSIVGFTNEVSTYTGTGRDRYDAVSAQQATAELNLRDLSSELTNIQLIERLCRLPALVQQLAVARTVWSIRDRMQQISKHLALPETNMTPDVAASYQQLLATLQQQVRGVAELPMWGPDQALAVQSGNSPYNLIDPKSKFDQQSVVLEVKAILAALLNCGAYSIKYRLAERVDWPEIFVRHSLDQLNSEK